MKKERFKQLLLCAMGFVLSCGNVYGINPFGLVFFTAMYMEKIYRILLCPIVLVAMMFALPIEQVVRYGIPMFLVMVVVELSERQHRICRKWKGYLTAGVGLLLMDISARLLSPSGNEVLLAGAIESCLVVSASFIMGGLIRFLLSSNQKYPVENHKEELLLQGPGKGKLLAYAESFRNLAGSFACIPEESNNPLEKQEMLWKSRFMDNRVALAGQLNEMAQIISEVAEEIYNVVDVGEKLEEKIRQKLRSEGILSKNILVVEKKEKRIEIYVTLKVERGHRIATKEIGGLVSEVCKRKMIPSHDSSPMIHKEYTTVFFEEDAEYKVLTGVARLTKDNEEISGDNYGFTKVGAGRMIVSLSDGMGSGERACKESQNIIELLEQFLEAGFSGEAAVQMINGSLVARSDEQVISSLDIGDIDLHNGVCNFIKIGASTTFIKRDSKVETLVSTSLPLGVFHKLDYDTVSKKLYDDDYIVMVTDDVMDRIASEQPEEVMCEIIRKMRNIGPREMAKKILSRVLSTSEGEVKDDMSVLVIGIWKK